MVFTIRETLRILYAKCDTWLRAGGKFLLAFISFLTIRSSMGQMELLNDTIILLILSLTASFLPFNAIVLFGTILILGHLYALSIPALIVGGGVLLIVLLLYFGLAPGHALSLILMPLALALKVPLLIPLAFGLLSTPLSGFGMAAGTIGYYSLKTILQVEGAAQAAEAEISNLAFQEQLLADVQQILNALVDNSQMVLTLIAILATLVVVFAVRSMEMSYAWQLAVGTGTLIFLVVKVFGIFTLNMIFSVPEMVIGTVVPVIAAIFLQLWFFDLDYRRTEKVQFEDDEYYYYVTAVPKRKREKERTVDEWTQ